VTAGPPPSAAAERRSRTRQARRRGRRRSTLRWALRFVVLASVFFLGLSLGRALEDAPQPGGTQRLVRTLTPGTAEPAPSTVTVTVANE
jgi:hypothetical protein